MSKKIGLTESIVSQKSSKDFDTKASITPAVRGLPTTGGRAGGCAEELCRSGSIRNIVWLMMHKREVIRKAAAESSGGLDLWASLVEQGLVALLEAVTNGMPVVSSSREKVGQK
eukprot:gene27334-30195_t